MAGRVVNAARKRIAGAMGGIGTMRMGHSARASQRKAFAESRKSGRRSFMSGMLGRMARRPR